MPSPGWLEDVRVFPPETWLAVYRRRVIWMPDLRLGVRVVEFWKIGLCANVCVSEARVPVITGLLCVFYF